MAEAPSIDDPLAWCRDRLLVPGHPLTVTLPYADPDRREALLALRCAISEIAAIPGETSDASVAGRKLDWWRDALQRRLPHPAIAALERSGVLGTLAAADFAALIDAVGREIEPPRFETIAEFEHHARAVAGSAARLEAAVVDDGAPDAVVDALERLAGAGYRVRVARDLVHDARQERWLIPLELQAEFQLTRRQVAEVEARHRIAALVRHVVVGAVESARSARSDLPAAEAWRHRHQLLSAHLDRRLAARLLRRPMRIARERVTPVGALGPLSTWRRARKLRREVGADAD